MKAIDLGRKSPEVATVKASKSKPQKHYPSLYIEHDGKHLANLPDSGTMTVRHRVTKRSVETDAKGNERHCLHCEIQSIEGAEGDPGEGDPGEDREADLDKIAAEEADKSQKD